MKIYNDPHSIWLPEHLDVFLKVGDQTAHAICLQNFHYVSRARLSGLVRGALGDAKATGNEV
ncbi:hypothetical protein E2C01_070073 [Portunus trituberculatus]|uniref:Uncharacterized protein n=1 Tax=Portunus trituberculatus TaxID=210409 RepID=A0A5B7HT92_PORTR|nr:hypothetical protein [Portunus trituberculatus]